MTKHVIVLPVSKATPDRQRVRIESREGGRGMAVSMTVALRYFAGRTADAAHASSSSAAVLPAFSLAATK